MLKNRAYLKKSRKITKSIRKIFKPSKAKNSPKIQQIARNSTKNSKNNNNHHHSENFNNPVLNSDEKNSNPSISISNDPDFTVTSNTTLNSKNNSLYNACLNGTLSKSKPYDLLASDPCLVKDDDPNENTCTQSSSSITSCSEQDLAVNSYNYRYNAFRGSCSAATSSGYASGTSNLTLDHSNLNSNSNFQSQYQIVTRSKSRDVLDQGGFAVAKREKDLLTVQKNDADNKRFSLVTIPRSRNGSELSVANNNYNLAKARKHAGTCGNIQLMAKPPIPKTMKPPLPLGALQDDTNRKSTIIGNCNKNHEQQTITNALDWLRDLLPKSDVNYNNCDLSCLLECTVLYINTINKTMNDKNSNIIYKNLFHVIQNRFTCEVNGHLSGNASANGNNHKSQLRKMDCKDSVSLARTVSGILLGKNCSRNLSLNLNMNSNSKSPKEINFPGYRRKRSKRLNAESLDHGASSKKLKKLNYNEKPNYNNNNLNRKIDFYNVEHLNVNSENSFEKISEEKSRTSSTKFFSVNENFSLERTLQSENVTEISNFSGLTQVSEKVFPKRLSCVSEESQDSLVLRDGE